MVVISREEPLGADDGGQFRPQHLDRHAAVVLDVLGQVDGGHAALAELALEAVAVGEGFGQAGEGTRHQLLHNRVLSLRGHAVAEAISDIFPKSRVNPRLG